MNRAFLNTRSAAGEATTRITGVGTAVGVGLKGALGGLMSFMGGPVGLAVVGLSLVLGGWRAGTRRQRRPPPTSAAPSRTSPPRSGTPTARSPPTCAPPPRNSSRSNTYSTASRSCSTSWER
ncbi:hypothetical protein ACFQ0M_48085 [Kitasatospora aburaviensis]